MYKFTTFLIALFLLGLTSSFASAQKTKELLIVVGAGGETKYEEQFLTWAHQWQTAANEEFHVSTIGIDPSAKLDDRNQLSSLLEELGNQENSNTKELWIVLIGHGTFNGTTAKFNLRGKDFSAEELKEWLTPIQLQTIVINCGSCSSPFVNRLLGPNRVVISATKSGYQYNFSQFGKYVSAAMNDETIDLDKDGQTSLLEAFITASAETQEFYKSEGRLATELAIIDDNSDGLGTPADWFTGTRVLKTTKEGELADGLNSNQIFFKQRPGGIKLSPELTGARNKLEQELELLLQQKSKLGEDAYYSQLEKIMVSLAEIYALGNQEIEKQSTDDPAPSAANR